MTDVHTRAQRTRNMAAIRSSGTRPELAVRRALHARGYRFRLQGDLPGCPDLVLAKFHCVIFVHGCFWHLHRCKYGQVKPATRANFWRVKREANARRDARAAARLRKLGWHVLAVWECQTRSAPSLRKAISRVERRLAALTAHPPPNARKRPSNGPDARERPPQAARRVTASTSSRAVRASDTPAPHSISASGTA